MYVSISSVNKDTLTSSISICIPFIIALTKKRVNNFDPDFSGIALTLFPFNFILTLGLL